MAVFFNTAHPDLVSKTFRQALAYGIADKNFEGERALSPINPNSWAYNPQVKPYEYNPRLAQEMIDKEFLNSEAPQPQLELTTTQAYIDIAEKIIASWEKLGITTNLKIVNFPDTNDYQILLIGQQIPEDPDQYTFWHSTQGTNFTHYNSPRVDKLLEDGRKTLDLDERTLIYQDFQRFLYNTIPIHHLIINCFVLAL